MRVYGDFRAAKNEIARDLNELGVSVFAGYQSKNIEDLDRDKLTTKELENYGYVVVTPRDSDLEPVQPWADAEWSERLTGIRGYPVNPGKAWRLRQEVWGPLLEADGRFSYTYSQRLWPSVADVVFALSANGNSRQAYVSIWDTMVDSNRLGVRRVPCSLGYHFMLRNGALDMTYTMRSSDFATHFDNDCWLALQLQAYVAERLDQPIGSFTHFINSLHTYAANVAGVF